MKATSQPTAKNKSLLQLKNLIIVVLVGLALFSAWSVSVLAIYQPEIISINFAYMLSVFTTVIGLFLLALFRRNHSILGFIALMTTLFGLSLLVFMIGNQLSVKRCQEYAKNSDVCISDAVEDWFRYPYY